MRTKICRGIAILLCLICLCSAALAQSQSVAGINVVGTLFKDAEVSLYLGMKAMSGNGAPTRADAENVTMAVAGTDVVLPASPLKGSQIGHIIVVDTSKYYYNNELITPENLQEIIATYLNYVPENEQVMFITATESEPVLTNYMSREEARAHAKTIEIGKQTSSCIYTSIARAFELAANPPKDNPVFNSVMILMDPDLDSNVDPAHSFSSAVMQHEYSSIKFDVVLATPYRDRYFSGTSNSRQEALKRNFGIMENFCQQLNGRYVEIKQSNDGVVTDTLSAALAAEEGSDLYFKVDCAPLRNYMPIDGGVQKAAISIYYNEQREQIVRTVEADINTSVMPTPDPTPEPTSEPAPTPAVAVGQKDARAMQAIHALYELHYLDRKDFNEFSNECFIAYLDFCKLNGIEPLDGIYEPVLNLLLNGQPVPMPTATPEPSATPDPTPTPMPTVPPEGYRINDMDTVESGGYIGQMQSILKKLNCYGDTGVNYGRLDQATVDAVAVYCNHFNWRNDMHPNGVTKLVCMEIITNGENLDPIPEYVPSFSEKFIAFLTRDIQLGSFGLPTWIPVAICVVILFVIMILVVVLKGKNPETEMSVSVSQPGSLQNLGTNFGPGSSYEPANPVPYSSAPYGPADNGEETQTAFCAKPVTLTVEFGGRSYTVETELKEETPYTIGRKDCQLLLDGRDGSASRKHAELFLRDGQCYVRDVSSHKNSYVNGRKIRGGEDGNILSNGDRLQFSEHVVTIKW